MWIGPIPWCKWTALSWDWCIYDHPPCMADPLGATCVWGGNSCEVPALFPAHWPPGQQGSSQPLPSSGQGGSHNRTDWIAEHNPRIVLHNMGMILCTRFLTLFSIQSQRQGYQGVYFLLVCLWHWLYCHSTCWWLAKHCTFFRNLIS